MKRYICIHGHFYQPPRENPWLEEVELQDSAHPYHDWNDRITAECYGPNASARIQDDEGRIMDIVNNYARINFNFGPTLLSWMERKQPLIYDAIREADRLSQERFGGHGSAIAQIYNHMIMPLATTRDKHTQIVWGLTDFSRRFGRDPEGIWLPETACDTETFELLTQHGITYTILAQNQAKRIRQLGHDDWIDVSGSRIDPTTPYICHLPSGNSLTLFFYDGPISQDIAFGSLLDNGQTLRDRLMEAFTDNGRDWPQLVHIATDGETFGHHHKAGEMALAWALSLIEADTGVRLTNYGEYLSLYEPQFEVEVYDNSAWSCVHGVERWRSDCGCNSGMHPGWNQAWRKPLREAIDWLSREAADVFDKLAPRYFTDPWAARDAYIDVILDRSDTNVSTFFKKHASRVLAPMDMVSALKLMELQRFAQLIFTSCGWFFDEISGIETVQILQYAVRTIQLAEEIGGRFLEETFVEKLAQAPSNVLSSGDEAYTRYAKPSQVDMLRVAAHFAISSLFESYPQEFNISRYKVISDFSNRHTAGRSSLLTGKAGMASQITTEYIEIQYAVLHPGDHNIICGIQFFHDVGNLRKMERELADSFNRGNLTETIRALDNHFGRATYSIWHLFRDEQRSVVNKILTPQYKLAENAFRQTYESNYSILNFLDWLDIPPPSHFTQATTFVIRTDAKRLFSQSHIDPEDLRQLMEEARKRNVDIHDETVCFAVAGWVNNAMAELATTPKNIAKMQTLATCLDLLEPLHLGLLVWKAQNTLFGLRVKLYENMVQRAATGDADARQWVEAFTILSRHLKVKLP
ncbi:DUF3536 domain-containing protein [Desulfovibrio inopinatus]|uniref:DUF3536 domain-containing protein n=1 Tax=Desulfovibrio inopinatus TaxID=102109 RepID=UPI0004033767|nr:DUF3536 domain-containing protein [Desulfovibrio inopinatus]